MKLASNSALKWVGMLAVFTLASCSNQQVYNAVQQNRIQHCEKYSGPEYQSCLQQYEKSYSEYQRQRGELDE